MDLSALGAGLARNIDWTYIVLVLPALLFASWASNKVSKTFSRYEDEITRSGITGAEAARRILDANGLQNVPIERVKGSLTDHYDPTVNTVRLSESVYGKKSTGAVGVACHEVGHALQYATGYNLIKLRMAIIPVTNIGSKLSIPLIIAGIALGAFSERLVVLAYIGVALFSLSTLFQLITLPVEINASRRALKQIESLGLLESSERKQAKEVLTAAALTYVAALATSITQLLRFLIIVGRSSNRRR